MLDDSFCFEESGSDYWSGSIIGKNASAKYTTLAFQNVKQANAKVARLKHTAGCLKWRSSWVYQDHEDNWQISIVDVLL